MAARLPNLKRIKNQKFCSQKNADVHTKINPRFPNTLFLFLVIMGLCASKDMQH